MSSSYHVLCLSHDPSIRVAGDYNRPGEAEDFIRDGDHQHTDCDLLIARVSGALVELGCPPTGDEFRRHQYQCSRHHETSWGGANWLRVLALAQRAECLPPALLDKYTFRCWPNVRLHRLREELDLEDLEVKP